MSEPFYTLVDFNGTLVHHERGGKVVDDDGTVHIGEPIPRMVEKVKKLLAQGMTVKIMCGTVGEGGPKGEKMAAAIREWTREHLGEECEPTGTVTTRCLMIWNDKAKEVVRNAGRFRHEDDDDRSEKRPDVVGAVMAELAKKGALRQPDSDDTRQRGLRRVWRR